MIRRIRKDWMNIVTVRKGRVKIGRNKGERHLRKRRKKQRLHRYKGMKSYSMLRKF